MCTKCYTDLTLQNEFKGIHKVNQASTDSSKRERPNEFTVNLLGILFDAIFRLLLQSACKHLSLADGVVWLLCSSLVV